MPYREPGAARLPLPPLPPMPPPAQGGYPHLGAAAKALGVEHRGAPELHLDLEGARVVASLKFSSATVNGITIEVFSGPYPDLLLRAETATDRAGKGKGINRELQLGDAEFDDRVYILSDAPDETLRAMLEEEEIRGAVRVLVGAGWTLEFSKLGVVLRATAADDVKATVFEGDRLRLHLESAGLLARVPRIPVDVPRRRRGARMFALLAPLVGGAGFVSLIVGLSEWEPRTVLLPAGGAAVGLVVWLGMRRVLAFAFRGSSDSYAAYTTASGVWLIAGVVAGAGVAVFANGAFGSAPRTFTGRIDKIEEQHARDGQASRVRIRWEDGTTSKTAFDDPNAKLAVGNPVYTMAGDGAFGVAWRSGAFHAESDVFVDPPKR